MPDGVGLAPQPTTDPLFAAAIDALFPGLDPILPVSAVASTTGGRPMPVNTRFVRIRDYINCSHALPDYWIPAQHKEARPQNVEVLNQFRSQNAPDRPFDVTKKSILPYQLCNLLVIEADNLLLPGPDEPRPFAWDKVPDARNEEPITEEWCRIAQPWAAHLGAVLSSMPFTLAAHSGGKSLHIYIRLSDHWEQTPRPSNRCRDPARARRWNLLLEVLGLTLGSFDTTVFNAVGWERYVRIPGGTRNNGVNQQILSVPGNVPTFDQFLEWGLQQLHPDVQRELRDSNRTPQPYPKAGFKRRRIRLDTAGWRNALYKKEERGDHRWGQQWFQANKELIKGGLREPEIIKRPNIESGEWGQYRAPFLWGVQAYVINELTRSIAARDHERPAPYGYVFTGDDWWWEGEGQTMRTWWRDPEEFADELDERAYGRPPSSNDPGRKGREQIHDDLVEMWAAQLDKPARTHQAPAGTGLTAEHIKQTIRAAKAPGQSIAIPPSHTDDGQRKYLFLSRLGPNLLYFSDKSTPWPERWVAFNGKLWDMVSNIDVETAANAAFEQVPKMRFLNGQMVAVPAKMADYHELAGQTACDPNLNIRFNGDWVQNEKAIAFENGTLYVDEEKIQFYPAYFDPNDRVISVIPYNYDATMPTPMYDHYLATSFPDAEDREMVEQFLGYCFYPSLPFKKFLLLVGQADSGKSTFLNLMRLMVGGGDHVAALSISSMVKDNYWAASLPKAKVMIISETADAVGQAKSATELLKKLTGDDTVPIRQMQTNPFNLQVRAKLAMVLNELPHARDDSKAFWNRVLLINPTVPQTMIKELADKMSAELPGIAAKAIMALQRLLRNGGFTTSQAMEARVQEFREVNSPLLSFWNEYMVPTDTPDEYSDLKSIMATYNHAVDRTSFSSINRFVSSLRTLGMSIRVSRRNVDQLEGHTVHHRRKDNGKTITTVHGWRCVHPWIQHITPPVVAMEDRGTERDPTPLPPPRREAKVIPMRPAWEYPPGPLQDAGG